MSRDLALERSKEQQRRIKAENDMTTAKYTPGPWQMEHVPDDGGEYAIAAANGILVGLTIGGTKSEQANARLIAAAPSLVFQLFSAANYIDTLGGDSKSYRIAIAKATGETK